MSIQVFDLAQSNLLQDLNTADSTIVIGGGGHYRSVTFCVPDAPVAPDAPVVEYTGSGFAGSISTGSMASFSSDFCYGSFGGNAIGFGSGFGSGFTAGSSTVSVGAYGASASGTAFTNGVSGVIHATFNRT